MIEIFKKLKKYNYWQKQKIEAGFIRDIYLNRINKYIGNNLIKVFIGQRRVGKSYILRQIIQELISKKVNPKNIFYLNKEIADFDEIKNYKDLKKIIEFYKKELKVKGKIYILLDEIQEIGQWEKIVNSLSQDYKEKYEIFLTGSNSKLLSGELSTYLSGRYACFEIFPFSFDEYAKYFNKPKDKNSFLKYLQTGGLPELYKLEDEEIKIHYVSSLRDTILLKDIVQRHKIKDAYLLENIFKFLTDNIGNLFSVKAVVDYLNSHKIKTNFETVSNYINYLLQSFLIYGVERFDIKGKAILSAGKKYYLNDLSFKNYFSSSFDYCLGKHLENIIYIHYRLAGYKIYVGRIGESEIDFIVEKGRDKKYIQAIHSLTNKKIIKKEFGNLKKARDAYEKIVISMDDVSLGDKNGIKHKLAWKIL